MSEDKFELLHRSLEVAFPDADAEGINQYVEFLRQSLPMDDEFVHLENVSLAGGGGAVLDVELSDDESPDFDFHGIDDFDTVINDHDFVVDSNDFSSGLMDYPIYVISARHDRHNLGNDYSPFHSEFMGQPMGVKVPLPQRDGDTNTIWTRLGAVRKSDHFLFSIDAVNAAYGQESGNVEPFGFPYVAEYVELVTCARTATMRFCPLSLYFIYRNVDDTEPSHYLLESGNGLGVTKVLYKHCVKLGEEFYEESQYTPTPFSDEHNTYLGVATTNGRDPATASVTSFHYHMEGDQRVKDEKPYITVTVRYENVDVIPAGRFPGTLIYHAASRIFTLMDGFGQKLFPFKLLAKNGRSLPWIVQPPNNKTKAPQ